MPTIDVEAVAARTNNPVCGAFRGFGANQAQFAMEGVLDRLAEQVGISGWEIRDAQRHHARRRCGARARSWTTAASAPRRCLDAVKPAYDAAVAAGKAVGLGLGLKNSRPRQRLQGGRQGRRAVRGRRHRRGAPLLDRDGPGRAHRRPAGRGRGARHRPRAASGCIVDTTRELGAGQTTGQPGHADGRRRRWPTRARRRCADGCRIGVDYEGEYRVDWTELDRARASSTRSSTPRSATPPSWSVIDRETGAIEQVVAAHDVGRAVNPLLCEGQIEGAVHMGLGYALTEDFPSDADGRPDRT